MIKGKPQAITKCDSDPNCFAIYDPGCEGKYFLICQNEDLWTDYPKAQESEISCIHMKPSKQLDLMKV